MTTDARLGLGTRMTRCLRCNEPYEPQRRSEHFCRDCAAARAREIRRERGRERYERAKMAIESAGPRAAEWAADLTNERLEEIGLALENGDPSLVLDKMPDGANSPLGPDEGRSTFFKELQGELDELSRVASQDPWWAENPHALYEVHDQLKAALYTLAPGPVCGDQRGTFAGYMRHRRAKELACPDCSEGNRTRTQQLREAV